MPWTRRYKKKPVAIRQALKANSDYFFALFFGAAFFFIVLQQAME